MLINAELLLVIAICVATDMKSRKIYNNVIFPSLLVALVLNAATGGWTGLFHSLLGFAAGFGILLIPYMMGGMGAGDVKLLALIGALKGTLFVLEASVYMAIFGAVLAVLVILLQKGWRERLRFFGYVLLLWRVGVKPDFRGSLSGTYPYGVAIAGGSALCLCLKGWGMG